MSAKVAFPERLRTLRERKGLSQEGLARALQVSRASIGYYEGGHRLPDIEVLEKIAEYFEVSSDYLIGRDACTTPTASAIHDITGLSQGAIAWFAINSIAKPAYVDVINRLAEQDEIGGFVSIILRYLVMRNAKYFAYDLSKGAVGMVEAIPVTLDEEDQGIREYMAQMQFAQILQDIDTKWTDIESLSKRLVGTDPAEAARIAREKLGV